MSIITVKEVSIMTKKSQKTIRRAILSNSLKATKIQNKLRINKEKLKWSL